MAHKLSELFAARNKPVTFADKFHNNNYYMPQNRKWTEGDLIGQSVNRWTNAMYWYNSARFAGIGVTGATDNFTWDPGSYNAVFRGDVAHWKKSGGKPDGHVAFVEDVQQDVSGQGVRCIKYSDYNAGAAYQFRFTDNWVCKNTPGHDFPDYFLHIDQDHAYCATHPTVDSCRFLNGDNSTVIASLGSKADGLGGGSDNFNLVVNNFWVTDASGTQLVTDTTTLKPGQVVTAKVQVKAKDGSTSTHMRPGKSRIEVDIYVRQNVGDWTFLKREYIQATNLPSGGTHTESVTYTVPQGVSEVSFKAKIDAEDEAYESNEGDNWTEMQAFSISSTIPVAPSSLTIMVTN